MWKVVAFRMVQWAIIVFIERISYLIYISFNVKTCFHENLLKLYFPRNLWLRLGRYNESHWFDTLQNRSIMLYTIGDNSPPDNCVRFIQNCTGRMFNGFQIEIEPFEYEFHPGICHI